MIRVFIVDEIQLMCDVMVEMFKGRPDMQLIGCATNPENAMNQARGSDILIASSTLPSDGALKLARAFKFTSSVKVIIVGVPELQPAILRYIESGAAGYVCREKPIDELFRTIRTVYEGQALISPEVAASVMARVAELAELAKPATLLENPRILRSNLDLTDREHEVLALMAQGLRNQDIARRLTIQVGTAKNHVHRILAKMKVKSREEAAACLGEARSPDQFVAPGG